MKITVELPESELREICEITGVDKKGPAIRKLLADSLQLQRRLRTTRKFLTGEWSATLEDYESSRQQDRQSSLTLADLWRD